MKRYAVVGASSGVGSQIVALLSAEGAFVRAISRNPLEAGEFIEPWTADVTDAAAMRGALDGDFDAVFFTVDIHGKGLQREQVRKVMVDGCANTVAAAQAGGVRRFVLLSVIGPEQGSWVWSLLNRFKPGMQENVLTREQALRASGMEYVVCRSARLKDGGDALPTMLTAPRHRLGMRRSIRRRNLARALIDAAMEAPANRTWDIFSGPSGSAPGRWLA
jgi:uncharacterized protein YbjT (DUF2867 family)